MKKVLILADQPQRASSIVMLAEKLCFHFDITILANIKIEQPLPDRIKLIDIYSPSPVSEMAKQSGKLKNLIRLLRTTSAAQFLLYVGYKSKLKKLYETVKSLIKENPDVIITCGDRGGVGIEQVLLKYAHDNGIKVIIPYFSIISSGVKLRQLNPKPYTQRTLFDKLVFSKYRNNPLQTDSGNLFFYDSPTTKALGEFGTLSSSPWMIGNGISDVVCADSIQGSALITESIKDPEKVTIVGDLSYDTLFAAYSNKEEILTELSDKYGFSPENFIIAVSVPQLYEHGILSAAEHWKEIDHLFAELGKTNATVLLSLHPKQKYENYKDIAHKHGLFLLNEKLASFLPVANLFIAINSSTVLWSLMCGIHSIILDLYELDNSQFLKYDNITFINNKLSLSGALATLMNKTTHDFSNDWEKLSREFVFDGKVLERYIDEINKL